MITKQFYSRHFKIVSTQEGSVARLQTANPADASLGLEEDMDFTIGQITREIEFHSEFLRDESKLSDDDLEKHPDMETLKAAKEELEAVLSPL